MKAVASLSLALMLTVFSALPASAGGANTLTLVSQEELGELEAKALAEAALNAKRRCVRPVLSGAPADGPADDDMVEVVEGEQFGPCYDAVGDHADALDEYFAAPVDPATKAPQEVTAACMALPAAMARAVQHADACSPYLFGRRAQPKLIRTMMGSKALAALIRSEGAAGNWKGAIEMTLNGLRFYQDLNRGPGASLIVAMVSTAAMQNVIQFGMRPLLEKDVPPEAEARQLARGIAVLLATDPPFCDSLLYERYGLALQMILPALKGDNWTPPGGFDYDMKPYDEPPTTPELGLSPGQSWALAWIAAERIQERLQGLCRANSKPADLYLALHNATEAVHEQATRQSQWKRLFGLLLSRNPERDLREWVVSILSSVALPSFDRYVLRYAQRIFMLQGLRLQLVVAGYARKNKVCPSLKMLEHPDFAPATVDPGSGKPMVITYPKNGVLRLAPAQETLDAAPSAEKAGSYEFSCPVD